MIVGRSNYWRSGNKRVMKMTMHVHLHIASNIFASLKCWQGNAVEEIWYVCIFFETGYCTQLDFKACFSLPGFFNFDNPAQADRSRFFSWTWSRMQSKCVIQLFIQFNFDCPLLPVSLRFEWRLIVFIDDQRVLSSTRGKLYLRYSRYENVYNSRESF